VNTYWLSYLPGTDMVKQGLEEGALTEADVRDIERGLSRTFHHLHLGRGDDAERVRTYRRYEVLFRALPLLPRGLRERVRASHVPVVPERVATAIGFLSDLVNAAARRDEETFIYAKHYAHHLRRELTGWLSGGGLQTPRTLAPVAAPAPARAAGGR
jgi:hypothetical protein